ncbi:phosphoenolpyruvate carboxylase, partial [Corallococcus exiguus]|nr:phosphoenolpyruvate carboxylase [Corallococcus exiguus]
LLGGELSLDGRYVTVSEQVQALAKISPDHSPHRQDEPYRRAITGIYARLATSALDLGYDDVVRHPVGDAPAYATVEEFSADLATLHRSLVANGSGALARGRLRRLRRAVDVFGFHLASIDLRQNSDV